MSRMTHLHHLGRGKAHLLEAALRLPVPGVCTRLHGALTHPWAEQSYLPFTDGPREMPQLCPRLTGLGEGVAVAKLSRPAQACHAPKSCPRAALPSWGRPPLGLLPADSHPSCSLSPPAFSPIAHTSIFPLCRKPARCSPGPQALQNPAPRPAAWE